MFAEVLHSAMRCLPVTPHENTELLVNPGPTRIQIGHMIQYEVIKYSIVHADIVVHHRFLNMGEMAHRSRAASPKQSVP